MTATKLCSGWLVALALFATTSALADEPVRRIDLVGPLRAPPPPPPTRSTVPGDPSSVIYPVQTLPLKFSHARHLARGAVCATCHPLATTSMVSRDNLLPGEAACRTCHAIDRAEPFVQKVDGPPTRCAACHVGFPSAPTPNLLPDQAASRIAEVRLPAPYLKFNHQLHAREGIDCARCHGDLASVDFATRAQLPKMEVCLGCHDEGPRRASGRHASSKCATCHLTQPNGTLRVQFETGMLAPSGGLRGDAHGPAFRTEHRMAARSEPSYCGNCHREDFCQACHTGIVRPLDFHGGNYLVRHGMEAQRDQTTCGSCHRRQTFCLGCHERLGVTDHATLPASPPTSGFFPASPRRFHPDGWASPFASANHHSIEAQRNLRSCTSCHREETCLACHTGLPGARISGGVSPHPHDFSTSGRCAALRDRNQRMCLKCHPDGSPALRCAP